MDLQEIPQDVLTQPTRDEGEDTPTWRARYSAAYAALNAAISGLSYRVYRQGDADLPTWLGDPDVITLFSDHHTTMTVLAFQLDADEQPLQVVQDVNFRLALRYRDRQPPWARVDIGKIIWWLLLHPELGVRPIELLGTDRELKLIELATDPESLR